jgi:hypothetical protein
MNRRIEELRYTKRQLEKDDRICRIIACLPDEGNPDK